MGFRYVATKPKTQSCDAGGDIPVNGGEAVMQRTTHGRRNGQHQVENTKYFPRRGSMRISERCTEVQVRTSDGLIHHLRVRWLNDNAMTTRKTDHEINQSISAKSPYKRRFLISRPIEGVPRHETQHDDVEKQLRGGIIRAPGLGSLKYISRRTPAAQGAASSMGLSVVAHTFNNTLCWTVASVISFWSLEYSEE
jgi:hypothetical protein